MSLTHAANPGHHSLAARGPDLYETPPAAVEALMRVERLPHHIWECACGPGSIVSVLRAAGHQVYATDLNDWGCPDSESGVDFLMEWTPWDGAIVTNSPYKLANQFVAHALKLCPRVIMLFRFNFYTSKGRTPILEN